MGKFTNAPTPFPGIAGGDPQRSGAVQRLGWVVLIGMSRMVVLFSSCGAFESAYDYRVLHFRV